MVSHRIDSYWRFHFVKVASSAKPQAIVAIFFNLYEEAEKARLSLNHFAAQKGYIKSSGKV